MEKIPKRPRLLDEMTKKERKEHHARRRGFPVPPSQIHKSDKDYDRRDNQQIINEGLGEYDEES